MSQKKGWGRFWSFICLLSPNTVNRLDVSVRTRSLSGDHRERGNNLHLQYGSLLHLLLFFSSFPSHFSLRLPCSCSLPIMWFGPPFSLTYFGFYKYISQTLDVFDIASYIISSNFRSVKYLCGCWQLFKNQQANKKNPIIWWKGQMCNIHRGLLPSNGVKRKKCMSVFG